MALTTVPSDPIVAAPLLEVSLQRQRQEPVVASSPLGRP